MGSLGKAATSHQHDRLQDTP